MPGLPTVHIRYDDNIARTRIHYENGDNEDLLVTPLGNNLYRLEESSLFGEASYRDVIHAARRDDGGLLFLNLETPSDLVMQSWVLGQEIIDSPGFRSILEQVMALGGNWEQAFGGLVLVHTPPDRVEEIAERIRVCGGSRS